MKKILEYTLSAVAAAALASSVMAQPLKPQYYLDYLDMSKTLRCDYIFSGTDKTQNITLAELRSLAGWAGRRVNMNEVPLRGNGRIEMFDQKSGFSLYAMTFSTLFQEWQAEEEATQIQKAFENVYLLPMPKSKAVVKVTLYDFDGNESAKFEHVVDPADILIRPAVSDTPYMYLHRGGPTEEAIDVAIVAEGYSKADMHQFYEDAQNAVDAFWEQEPFASMKDRFNFIAVAAESEDSGVSVPRRNEWKKTAVDSHFDTFYSDRYLTTTHLFKMHDLLASIPYEHLIVLANTDTYGGGGIYNSYTLTTTHHSAFAPVVVHEFGHSFAGLADEYFYDDQFVNYYSEGVEPWERNITTKADFASKWQHLMPKKSKKNNVYSEQEQAKVREVQRTVNRKYADRKAGKELPGEGLIIGFHEAWPEFEVGLYEGAGYMSKGVYRGYPECRMKINEYPEFCPVCQEAITDIINFYTVQNR